MTTARFLPRSLSRRAVTGAAALSLSLGGAVGAFVVAASPASADTIDVTNTADDGSATSLRGVLESASDGDVVVLTVGATYHLTICAPAGPDALEGSAGWGDVEITGAVTIQGNGATIVQTCPDRVLYTQSDITLNDVTITGGAVDGLGGGLFQDSDSTTALNGATFVDNAGVAGGGVATSGDVTTTASTFSANQATDGNGGGLYVVSDVATVAIDGTTFDQNHASQWGGAIEQETRDKAGATAAGQFNLTVTNSTITANTADGDGGGGIDTEDPAEITIDHSTLSGNSGGIGGAVGTFGSSTSLHATASTFNGNTSDAEGGAVQMSGTLEAAAVGDSSADFTNSTITGNTAASFGAIAVTGAVRLDDVTLVGNTSLGEVTPTSVTSSGRGGLSAQAVEGDAANVAAFTLTSFASVVAQPQGAANCVAFDTPTTDSGYNFSDDPSCGFTAATSKVSTPNDPLLGALANNGGPTQTLLPRAGSPLLDVVPPAACGLTVDQRGITRPQGTGCDIGAVEVEVAPAPAPAAVVTPRFTG